MLSHDVERYVALQITLGYKFEDQSRSLQQFARYAMTRGDKFVRVERVLAWSAEQTASASTRQTLVARVRRFALALHAEDSRHEVPSRDCVGHAKVARRTPYIYTADEITRIMRATEHMWPNSSIRPETLSTLVGLLAATGVRISEALSLQCSDIREDGLLIHKAKLGKSRFLPLHPTTRVALERHLSDRARRPVYTQAVFVSKRGQALKYPPVLATFRRLLAYSGLASASLRRSPRIHDLRHTFAVRSLAQCQHDRRAVEQHMVALSTYLGHARVTDTYWYLEAVPIIMSGIAKASEAMYQRGEV